MVINLHANMWKYSDEADDALADLAFFFVAIFWSRRLQALVHLTILGVCLLAVDTGR